MCAQLRLTIHIIEDFSSEAANVHKYNPWAAYSPPLHRIKEFGVTHTSWVILKCRGMSPMEMKRYCTSLFGCDLMITSAVDTDLDHSRFLKILKIETKKACYRNWDPYHQKQVHVLDVKLIANALGQEESCYDCCSIS